jgi:glycosyltransferase involved in cell wall biosynthesis
VVHIIDQGNGVYIPWLSKLPHLVTCHDLIAIRSGVGIPGADRWKLPERPSVYQRLNRWALAQARYLACASLETREECIQLLAKKPAQCFVVYNPLPTAFLELAKEKPPPSLPDRYLLHVGNSAWYKNRLGLLRIYFDLREAGCELPLVLIGEPPTAAELQMVAAASIKSHVRFLQGVGDQALATVYAGAEALLFPSLQEGFGWPIIEALSQGTAVFTTNSRPMTEVGGPVAYFLDPDKPAEAAQTILEILDSPENEQAKRQSRIAWARQFRLDDFVDGYLAIYRDILSGSKPASIVKRGTAAAPL